MSLRKAKRLCKQDMRRWGLVHVATHGRTFVVKPRPNFLCARWYSFIIVAENHEKLAELIAEGKKPL